MLLPAASGATPARAADESAQSSSVMSTGPVPALSTATSNTVREADGSLTMTAYTQPVNYRDDSGRWVPIDNTLVESSGAAYDVQNAANSFVAKIPQNPSATPIKLVEGSEWVTMQMRGIANAPAEISGDTATFEDVAEADGVDYQITNTGLKEAIRLDSAPSSPIRYTYTLDASSGLTPTVQGNGAVVFRGEDGHVSFIVPPGTMYDSAAGEPSTSDDVDYALKSDGAQWTLAVTPSAAWLTDPERVYPVVIDPSLDNQHDVVDCNLRSAVPDNTACGDQTTYLKAGRSDASHKYRGAFNFDVTSIPTSATVTNATVHLNLDQAQTLDPTQSADYALYAAGKKFVAGATWNSPNAGTTWNGGSPGTTTYATKTLKGDTGGDRPFFGLDGLVQTWVKDPSNNTGLIVKQVGETTNNILSFYSNASSNPAAKRPYIDVNYTTSPTSPALSFSPCLAPCDTGWSFTGSLTPTLSATSIDADGGTLAFTFQIRNADSQAIVSTGTASAPASGVTPATWPVPSGALADKTVYEVRAGASDGTTTTWGAWSTMGVDLNAAPSAPVGLSLSPCQGACGSMVSTSTTPILAASATDADDFMVGLTFEVRRAGTTTVLASGQSASAEGEQGTFQVPSGVLSNGDSFEFRVGAADMQTSTWSSWASGTIAVPTGQQMPTAVALTSCQGPCENWISDTANPTFTATRPAGSGSAGLVFEIRDGVGFDTTHEVLDVAPQSRATWSVPAGTLGVGGYDLRVGTRIADTTIWSAWYQFGIDPEVTDGADFPLSDAPQTNAETVPSDPNATPDPARDSADTGPVSTYGEADEDALDAKVALDEADATSAGLSRNTDSLSSRRVSIPLKYAPRAHIHPGEKDFPMSPDTFLNHSDVMWFGYACGKLLIDKTPEPVTLGGGGYTHKPTTGNDYCNGQGTLYRSDDNVRPGDEGNSIFQGQGMYLNLNNSYRDGQGFQGDEPVFYDYQPKKYLLYWFSWGNSYEKPPGVTVGTHEGDWERVAIKLDSNNDPRLVQYFYHYDSCTLKWGDAPRKGNRLNLWIAQHAHGVYPANAVTPGYKHAGYTYHDSISGDGPTWYASNNLDNVRTQDWFGYGGGWGEKYGHFGGQWGPLGPNSYHSNTPPTFSSNKCDVH